jgi:cell division ATPase FtsA
VLAGGGISLLRGIREFGSRVMGIPVRLGVPDVIGLSSPALSAVYALGCSTLNEEVNRLTPLKVLRALIRRFKK